MSRVTREIRRAALAVQNKAEAAVPFTFRTGTIDSTTPGGSTDGLTAAFVNVGGSVVPAPYLSSYTPVVNDHVLVLLMLGSPVILGKVVGLPSF